MKLAVIILNWNQAAATIRCVDFLRAWKRAMPEVWVVDNASTDGSREIIPRSCPAVSYVYSAVNLGFAGGNNLALRKIIAGGNEAVLLLNNDAGIGEDQVLGLLAELQANPRLGVVGPLLEERHGNRRIVVAGGRDMARCPRTRIIRCAEISTGRDGQPVRPSSVRAVGSAAADCPALPVNTTDVTSLSPVDYVPGAAVIISVELLRKIGLFDEDFFFSGEMADLCRRARAAGWTCAVSTRALAAHAPAGGALRDTLYLYYTLRNRFLFVRKHEPGNIPNLFAFWLGIGALMAALAFVRGRPAQTRAAWLALRDGLSGRYGNRNYLFILT